MKRFSVVFLLTVICVAASAQTAGTVLVHDTQLPVLVTQPDNILFKIRVEASEGDLFGGVSMAFDEGSDVDAIQSLKLYYGGMNDIVPGRTGQFQPYKYLDWREQYRGRAANPSYSILLD